jgi:hypothetical protein
MRRVNKNKKYKEDAKIEAREIEKNDAPVKKAKKEDREKWIRRYEWTRSYYQNADQRNGWTKYKRYFLGQYAQELGLDFPAVIVNEVYAYVKTGVAGLYTADPYITINPKNREGIRSAYIKEQMANYWWRHQDIGRQVKRNIFDAKLCGFSWFKVGYEADIKKYEGETPEPNEYIAGENIFGVAIPQTRNNYVLWDPEAIDPAKDSRWIMHCYTRPTDYLRDKYNISNLEPSHTIGGAQYAERQKYKLSETDSARNMVIEIWDKDSGCKMLMLENIPHFIDVTEAVYEGCVGPYAIKGLPFECLYFNEVLDIQDDNFPMPEIAAIEPQILEKIKYRSIMANHLKRYARQMFFKTGAFKNKNEMQKFLRGVDAALIEMNTEPSTALYPSPYPPVQTDIYATENRTDVDRDRVSGQSQMEQGAPAVSKTRTLGEVNQIMAGVTVRKQEQINTIEAFCRNITSKYMQLCKQFFDVQQVVRVTGEKENDVLRALAGEGKYDGVSLVFTKEDIQGDEDTDIVPGSTIPMNKENRMRAVLEAARVGQAFGLTPDSNAAKAAGRIFFRDLGIEDLEQAYEMDMAIALEREKQKNGDPRSKMQMLKGMQDIKKSATDTKLKQTRITSNNLRNAEKAMHNAQLMGAMTALEGEQQNDMSDVQE